MHKRVSRKIIWPVPSFLNKLDKELFASFQVNDGCLRWHLSGFTLKPLD